MHRLTWAIALASWLAAPCSLSRAATQRSFKKEVMSIIPSCCLSPLTSIIQGSQHSSKSPSETFPEAPPVSLPWLCSFLPVSWAHRPPVLFGGKSASAPGPGSSLCLKPHHQVVLPVVLALASGLRSIITSSDTTAVNILYGTARLTLPNVFNSSSCLSLLLFYMSRCQLHTWFTVVFKKYL